jgi:archaetidylinositol phosphate synthase
LNQQSAELTKEEKGIPGKGSHTRINDILLGPLERPALQWLAAHLPTWATPDMLTAVGFLGTLVIAVGYLFSRINPAYLWVASIGFVIHWFGDSMDGTLARHRQIERPMFGFYIDHVLDAFSETIILLSLGLSTFVRFDLACLALISYLLLGTLVFIRTYVLGEFKISYGKLGPTEARVIMILANCLAFFTHNPSLVIPVLGKFTLLDGIIIFFTILILFFSISSAIQGTIELARLGE